MAERFIQNLHIAPDRSEQEAKQLALYKQVASLQELSPVFIYFSSFCRVFDTGGLPPVVGLFGTEFKVQVKDIYQLQKTISPHYFWEVQLLDSQVGRYTPSPLGTGNVPIQPVYIKLNNLTPEPYDFEVVGPTEKQNNRIIYLKQPNFPNQLDIKIGHCETQQANTNFGKYYDINSNVAGDGVADPFKVFYNQKVFKISFRLQVKQIHAF
jgi:hypothetical protein